MPITVKADKLKRIVDVLRGPKLSAAAANALRDGAELVLNTPGARNYPSSSEANTPGRFNAKTRKPMGYYLRGQGWFYPIMRRNNTSETAAVASKRAGFARGVSRSFEVAGYKLRATSERYGTQFYTRSATGDGYASVVIGNRASYATYLGFRRQAKLSAARGWRQLGEIAGEKRGQIAALVTSRIADAIKKEAG